MSLKLNKIAKNNLPQKGFTLVEIAIVLVILGSMISISISAFLAHEERTRVNVTKQRLEIIKTAMDKFLEINGRYPCPVSFALRPEDIGAGVNTTFGIESRTNGVAVQSCRYGGATPPAGTVFAPRNSATGVSPSGNAVGHTRIGAVPVRTLNLPDEFAIDAWGGLLTYAVVVTQATAGAFFHDGGDIRIIDVSGASVINPNTPAHYIVLSHGSDQLGARVAESNIFTDVKNPCPGAANPQNENCDPDSTFRLSKNFDDLAIYDVQRRRDDILPSGTVLPFDSNLCPQGWIEYFGAGNRGRFLMGLDDAATTVSRIGGPGTPVVVKQIFDATVPGMVNVSDSRGVVTTEYFLGDVGADGVGNIPRYLALRYCVKQ